MVAVVVAAVMAGCTGSSDAGPTNVASVDTPVSSSPTLRVATPNPSTSPTVSPTPPVAKPTRPAGMNANTVEGAKKTALYFLRLFPYALTTGDLKEFNALSYRGHGDADCGFCSSTRSQVKEYVKSHKTYSGGAISARVVKSYDRDALYDLYPLDIEVEQARGVVHAADGSVDSYTRASSNVARVEVIRVENGWKILTVTHAKSDS